jgi:hypothetical protein
MDRKVLKQAHDAICDIINAHDGLWRKVAEVARKREHVREENPFQRLKMEMDAIEDSIGVTKLTKGLRATIAAHC